MSFITQCPACETQFKVAPDQLKISEGWVRCGQCQHVFDASLNLQPWFPEPEPPTDPAPAPAPVPVVEADAPTLASELVQTNPDLEPRVPEVHDDLQEPRFDLDALVEPSPLKADQEPTHPPEVQESVVVTQPLPSFMKKAMEKAHWHRTSVRVTLYTLIILLAMALAAQWLYRHKNELFSNYPDLRPIGMAVCSVLPCEIQVPRKLSEVVIDSSSFVRGQANRFDFQLMLRNRANAEVAMPTLELTLTDIDNQVIARRIIPPTEWPQQPTSLGPQAVWSLRLGLQLDMPPAKIVTGYQAELFYP